MHKLSTAVLLFLSCCNGFSNRDLVNYSLPLDGIMDSLNLEPEIIYLHVDKSWDKFIWIDYPNEVSWGKYRKAKEEGLVRKDEKIGGEIGIHGVPKGTDEIIDLGMNWTLGCISLKNEDINDFYPIISNGTVVIIQK